MELAGEPPFGFRPIQHIEGVPSDPPRMLALDGQQRLTTLAHAFCVDQSSPNDYFFNLRKLHVAGKTPESINLEDEGVIEILRKNQNRSVESALLGEARLAAHLIFDSATRRPLLSKLKDKEREAGHQAFVAFLDTKLDDYLDVFETYRFPAVVISDKASLEVVSTIFTEINTQQQTLTSFDLCVAKFFSQSSGSYRLRDDLRDTIESDPSLNIVDGDGTNFLQTIALLSPGVDNKKAGLADNLKYSDVQSHRNTAFETLRLASSELQAGAKIESLKEVPYDSLIPPLAASLVNAPTRVADKASMQRRITQWVLAAGFKRRYTEGTDVTQREDISSTGPWAVGKSDDVPAFVTEPWIITDEVLSTSANSSRGKAMMLCLRLNDWKDPMLNQDAVDSHHVFPAAYLRSMDYTTQEANRFLNRTWLSKSTNQSIGSKKPSEYITQNLIPSIASRENLNPMEARTALMKVFEGHLIDHDAFAALEADDYESFLNARAEALGRFLHSKYSLNYAMGDSGREDEPIDEGDDDE